jgi:hypothetical protein
VLVLTAAVFGLSAMWRGVGPKVFAQACAISSLTGMARTMDGKVLEGVAVSARAVDRSVTTSVFTDERGEYVFPPLDGGRYQVWAQAVGYETARADVAIGATKPAQQAFSLNTIADITPQLVGSEWIAALPEETKEQRRMKEI